MGAQFSSWVNLSNYFLGYM